MLLGISIAAAGSLFALLVGSGTIPLCLGPLAVTPVRCANATGIMPTAGAALPMTLMAIALGALVVVPPRRARLEALFGGLGLILGMALYLMVRPTVLEGPDYDGTWLSLPMPVELDAFVAAGIAGAFIGLVVASVSLRTIPGNAREH